MITSWNVNQILGKRDWEKLKGDYDTKEKIWKSNTPIIIGFIKRHLLHDDDLVLLHEVPYVSEEEYCYNGEINYKRSNKITSAYENLIQNMSSDGYEVIEPITEETAFFRSIAICKKGAYRQTLNTEISSIFENFKNRIICIESTDNTKETVVIGVHIPTDLVFWKYIYNIIDNIPNNKMVICGGDFNTFKPDTEMHKCFSGLLNKGFVDVWIGTGNPNETPTFDAGTRIDYFLISSSHFNQVDWEMSIDNDVREKFGYSDHSAIILSNKD